MIENSNDKPFHSAQLDSTHIDALQRVAYLSMVPGQILEVFGSYDEFKKAAVDSLHQAAFIPPVPREIREGITPYDGWKKLLERFGWAGIDTAEMTPTQILYEGGLGEFVRALELRKKGELGKLDSSSHVLKDTLDDRDHFTKLFENLQKLKQPEENRNE